MQKVTPDERLRLPAEMLPQQSVRGFIPQHRPNATTCHKSVLQEQGPRILEFDLYYYCIYPDTNHPESLNDSEPRRSSLERLFLGCSIPANDRGRRCFLLSCNTILQSEDACFVGASGILRPKRWFMRKLGLCLTLRKKH